jgi:hypothetical protein
VYLKADGGNVKGSVVLMDPSNQDSFFDLNCTAILPPELNDAKRREERSREYSVPVVTKASCTWDLKQDGLLTYGEEQLFIVKFSSGSWVYCSGDEEDGFIQKKHVFRICQVPFQAIVKETHWSKNRETQLGKDPLPEQSEYPFFPLMLCRKKDKITLLRKVEDEGRILYQCNNSSRKSKGENGKYVLEGKEFFFWL